MAENEYDYRGGEIGVTYHGEIPYIIGVKNIENYKIYGYELGLSVEEMKTITELRLQEFDGECEFGASYDAKGNKVEFYDETQILYSVIFIYFDGEFDQVLICT